ncbi:MAG: hypothetical protein PF501_12005 [Salinisphaera sp.]|jgi:hypothetical protein|nr:hypothetical protein [Salinisphaera sp.]
MRSIANSGRFGRSERIILFVACAILPLAAEAYVGPGAGLSLLSALWGLLAAIGAAFLFLIMWPIRRIRRKKREADKARHEATPAARKADESADHEHHNQS